MWTRSSLLVCLAACASAPARPLPPAPSFEEAPAPADRSRVPDAEALNATLAAGDPATDVAVTLDRPLYRPGEPIWIRLWERHLDADLENAPSAVSVQLRNHRDQVVARTKLVRHEGVVQGALDVPDPIAGGAYTLRVLLPTGDPVDRPLLVATFEEPRIRKELDLLRDAYGPNDEVQAVVALSSSGAGPLIHHDVRASLQVDGREVDAYTATTDDKGELRVAFELPQHLASTDATLIVAVEEGGWTEAIARPIPIVLDRVQVAWFPEGGDLVAGLHSHVYLRATDPHGEAADVAGIITDDQGLQVATFRTLHDGLGRTAFTPEPGRTYVAEITEPRGLEVTSPLPTAAAEGCVLHAYDDLDGQDRALRVGVTCDHERSVVVTGALAGHDFEPALVTAGPDLPAVVHLSTGTRAHDRLRGVARVTVVGVNRAPLAERLVFRNRHRALKLELTPQEDGYGPRDEVVLDVIATDPDGNTVEADLAVSVVDDRLLKFADDEHGSLLTQALLDPWLQAALEDPSWYFDPNEPDAGRGLDLIMGTQGWRRFAWQDLDEEQVAQAELAADHVTAEPALRDGPRNGADLDDGVLIGIGDLGDATALGAQAGAIGLGGRGTGLAGGGAAEGLGLLGVRGTGAGAAGYGAGAHGGGGAGFGAAGNRPRVDAPTDGQVVMGALDRDIIRRQMRRHHNQLRYCYQRILARHPHIEGRVVAQFNIQPDGAVGHVAITDNQTGEAEVAECVAKVIRRMRFPAPGGGGHIVVKYPLMFSPQGGSGMRVVREFPQPVYRDAPPPETRNDFRSTVHWAPTVRTNAKGQAQVRFWLSDLLTTYRVTAEGVAGPHVGRAEVDVHSVLPFELDTPLPTEVSFGDRLLLPVRLRNRRRHRLDVELHAEVQGPMQIADGSSHQTLWMKAHEGVTTLVPVDVDAISRRRSHSDAARPRRSPSAGGHAHPAGRTHRLPAYRVAVRGARRRGVVQR